MSWLAIEWLWLLLPLGAVLGWRLRRGEPFDSRRRWLLLAALLLVAAACRPVLPKAPVEVESVGSDVIVAIDLSRSMQASDLKPTRLEAAGKLLETLVRQNRGDRYGVIGFTTSAVVLSPLTSDGELLLHLFGALDPRLILTRGTDYRDVLKLARRMSRAEHPVVLLLTDGGDGLNYSEEAAYAKEAGLRVNVVMLATRRGSTLEEERGGVLKDDGGNIVVTSRNDAVRSLSDATGGAFLESADAAAVASLLESQARQQQREKRTLLRYRELFYYFVGAALLAFTVAMTTLRRRIGRLLAAAVLLAGVSGRAGVFDAYEINRGVSAYRGGEYEAAARHFAAVDDPGARYNAANSHYRAGNYGKALELYRSIRPDSAGFAADLWFNIADCYIRLQQFEPAKAALRRSLGYRRDDAALENLYALERAESQDRMSTGKEEGKARDQQGRSDGESESGEKKKSGGSSNMEVDAAAEGGSDAAAKPSETDPRLGFSRPQGVMSSRQYERINQRSVHETKPW